ncbi:hypothetical protein A0O28_0003600 [Trichoderma guizhouense]|uniref:DUF7580 domain-containing protein n=1 Tax=Trichoderma guizhouense TaxID=1491466 RepID=A0A1T3CGZ1_9HYPO|nr:hypothetical protein A0O28_0003600 [Trichoderma guizhouense]
MITAHLYYQYPLSVVFNHKAFRYEHERHSFSFPGANTYISLRDLLDKHTFPKVPKFDTDNSKYYSFGDRYLLGLNLAKSLFHLFDGPWRPLNWKTEDIGFPATETSTSMTVHSRHSPYIQFSLDIGDEENRIQKRQAEDEKLCYPMWLALAQILLELHLGRSLAHKVEDLDKPKLRKRLLQISDSELRDNEFDSYKEAIEACLNIGYNLFLLPRKAGPAEARRLIRNLIIAKLEKNYEKWSSTLGEYTDLDLTSNQQSRKPEDITASSLNKDAMAITPIPPPSFLQRPPTRSSQAESTFHLAPRFTIKPPPYGPLHLGTIIDDLKNVEPINETCRLPLPGDAYKHITEGFFATTSRIETGECGVWAKFVVERMGSEASLTGGDSAKDIYTKYAYRFEKLEEITFTPTKKYMTQSMNEPAVKDFVEGGGWDPVYMITGLKIVRGPTITWQKSKSWALEESWKWEKWEKCDDFIYGIRVKRLYFKRGVLSARSGTVVGEYFHYGARWADIDFDYAEENLKEVIAEDISQGDEEMEAKAQVMDGEEIWVTPI